MFKTGEVVRNVARDVVGVVIETDGDTVYIEQPNGCEVNFEASALVLESEFQARHDRAARPAAAPGLQDRLQNKVYEAVLANVYPAILQMAQLAHARAERAPGIAAQAWDALSALQKLTAVSLATDVPVKAWIDANEPGARPGIGALQLSVLAAANRKPVR